MKASIEDTEAQKGDASHTSRMSATSLGETASWKGPVTTVFYSVVETRKPRDFLSTVLFRVILVEMSPVTVGLVASQAHP